MGSKLAANFRFLREHKKMSQEEFGQFLGGLTRGQIASYEDGRSEPKSLHLINMARILGLTVDMLLTTQLTQRHLEAIAKGHQPLQEKPADGIPLISQSAYTEYLQGHTDKVFLEQLPMLFIPGLKSSRTHRAFEVRGESMIPTLYPNDWVICRKQEKGEAFSYRDVYLLITRAEGVLVKRLIEHPEQNMLELISDNRIIPTYKLPIQEVNELWKVEYRLTSYLQADITESKLNELKGQILALTNAFENFKSGLSNS